MLRHVVVGGGWWVMVVVLVASLRRCLHVLHIPVCTFARLHLGASLADDDCET